MIILEAVMLVMGIWAIVKGRFSFTRNRVIEGRRARVVGIAFVLPIPLTFLFSAIIGFNAYVGLLELVIIIGAFLFALVQTRIGAVSTPIEPKPSSPAAKSGKAFIIVCLLGIFAVATITLLAPPSAGNLVQFVSTATCPGALIAAFVTYLIARDSDKESMS